MGISSSCYSGGGTTTTDAAVKLVLLDGQLREFPSPVKVFLVAAPASDVCSFICNADEMDFDKHVTAMSDDEELRLGQLYFQLPSSWLNRRLAAEDMASLAVKAGTALMIGSRRGGKVRCGCCVKRVDPFFDDEMMSTSWSTDDGSSGGGDVIGVKSDGGGRRVAGGGKGRLFTSLERIEEE